MTGYVKLFGSILGSTIWREDAPTKVAWITLLALADRDGIAEASIPGLANYAGLSVEATEAALRKFLAPDPWSRTPDHEGRRIEKVDGGWRLLNHDKYRFKMSDDDRRERDRIRKRKYRATQRATCPTECGQKRDTADDSGKSHKQKQKQIAEAEEGKPPAFGAYAYDGPTPEGFPPEQYALSVIERLCVVPDGKTPDVVRHALVAISREEKMPLHLAHDAMVERGKAAKANGTELNRFWFTDRKFLSTQVKQQANSGSVLSPAERQRRELEKDGY